MLSYCSYQVATQLFIIQKDFQTLHTSINYLHELLISEKRNEISIKNTLAVKKVAAKLEKARHKKT